MTLEGAPMLGTRALIGAVAALLVLAVMPPFLAIRVMHERRLLVAQTALDALAVYVRDRPVPRGIDVLVGAGDRPRSTDSRWVQGTSAPMEAPGPDPWGNCYLANVGAPPDAIRWVLSAGPNGIIETPFAQWASPPSGIGDDLVATVRGQQSR